MVEARYKLYVDVRTAERNAHENMKHAASEDSRMHGWMCRANKQRPRSAVDVGDGQKMVVMRIDGGLHGSGSLFAACKPQAPDRGGLRSCRRLHFKLRVLASTATTFYSSWMGKGESWKGASPESELLLFRTEADGLCYE